MTSSRGPRVCLIVIFLVLIGIVAPSQIVLDLRNGETPGIADLFRQTPTRANLRRLESDLESKCRLAQAVRPWVQYARFVLLQDAGDKALLGRDGWFFYRPAVQYLVEPVRSVPVRACPETPHGVTTNGNDILAAIVSFRDDLAKRGIKLLVMPAPNKSSIYPEMLTGPRRTGARPEVPVATRRPESVLAMLKQAGVEVVDLFEVYARYVVLPVRACPETPSRRHLQTTTWPRTVTGRRRGCGWRRRWSPAGFSTRAGSRRAPSGTRRSLSPSSAMAMCSG